MNGAWPTVYSKDNEFSIKPRPMIPQSFSKIQNKKLRLSSVTAEIARDADDVKQPCKVTEGHRCCANRRGI